MPTLRKFFHYFPHYLELLGKRLNGKGNMNPHRNGEYKVLKKAIFLSKNQPFTYVDAGANIGDNVVQAHCLGMQLNKSIEIIAIEPIKQTFSTLRDNTSSLKATLLNTALGNSLEPLEMQVDPEGPCSGSNSAFSHYYLEDGDTETVSQTTLDQLALDLNLSHIDFLKLDIEGFELNAIFGATKLIKNSAIDFIQLEYNQTWIKANSTIEKLLKFISDKDYSLYRITPNELLKISAYHYTIEDFQYSNLLLARNCCTLPLDCKREVSPATLEPSF